MKQLLAFGVLVVIGLVILGYYRDWFSLTSSRDPHKVNINVTVDKDKLKEDEQRAKEKIHELGGQIKEGAEKFSEKVKKP